MPRKPGWMLVALALASGCAKTPPSIVEVHGVVRLEGVPLKKVEVRFIPTDEFASGYIAKGVTDDAGEFTLICKGKPGACVGENQVLVLESDYPSNMLHGDKAVGLQLAYRESLGVRPPERYANLVDSPLKVTVNADQKEYNLNLTREK